MTTLKMICNNVKKNIKDYQIYFVTLMIAVAIFYSFNSIESQNALKTLGATGGLLADQLGKIVSLLSYVVAVVLAFLIIYANQFIMRRRKKELGIYMILGMRKRKISRIFVGETFIIGLISLVAGFLLGFVLSQGLSLLAINLFEADMAAYQLTISATTVGKTIIAFAIIFVLVMIFNVRTVSTVKLIDLLKADRKNEMLIIKSKWVGVSLLTISIGVFGICGFLVNKDGILPNSDSFLVILILMICATLIFFFSLAIVFLETLKANKKIYFKGLNMFLVRQIGNKIQTNFISMSIICWLLTITICLVSAGMSIALTMNLHAKESAPYDLTAIVESTELADVSISDFLISYDLRIDKYLKDSVEVVYYTSNNKYEELLMGKENSLWRVDEDLPEEYIQIIGLNDYNRSMALQGKAEIILDEGEFLLNCNYKGTFDILSEFINNIGKIELNGITLEARNDTLLSETITMTSIDNNDKGTIIVNDTFLTNLEKDFTNLNAMFYDDIDSDVVLRELLEISTDRKTSFSFTTKDFMYEMYYGTKALGAFICLYVGLIFLIVSVSILALQQLTETSDNIHRYGLLRKMGASQKSLNKTLFKQISIYFFTPLTIAAIFSIVGIMELIKIIEKFLGINIEVNIVFTIALFLIIYGSYFWITYCSCKKMISK